MFEFKDESGSIHSIYEFSQIRLLPHEFTDVVVIHCHILAHEDEGMMMVVKVVGESKKCFNI